jgi:hypothetical protein
LTSCGSDLEKANKALEETSAGERREVPDPVKKKWGAALSAAHGEGCKFKNERTNLGLAGFIKGWHIIEFEIA